MNDFDLSLKEGEYIFRIAVPNNLFIPNDYFLTVGIHRPNIELYDFHENFINFSIEEAGSLLWKYLGQVRTTGNILLKLPWKFEKCP